MPYKLKKVKGGWQVTSPGHPQGFKKKPHKNKEDAMDQLAAIKIHAKESIPLIKSMLQEAMIGQIGHDRLSNLSDLLSQVETGKLSAVVAADMAGLIDPSEESIGEDASLARLKWEIESLEGSLQELSENKDGVDQLATVKAHEIEFKDIDVNDVPDNPSVADLQHAQRGVWRRFNAALRRSQGAVLTNLRVDVGAEGLAVVGDLLCTSERANQLNTIGNSLGMWWVELQDNSKSLEGSVRVMKESNTLDKKTPTEEELASKYGVDISTVREAARVGTEVELEHTNDHEVAKEIALDHLGEKLDYYDKPKEIE